MADENLPLRKLIEKVVLTGNEDKKGKNTVIFFAVLLSLFFMGYTVKGVFFLKKECMQWEGNHYIAVDCANDKLEIGQLKLVIPIDENIMKLNKLDCDSTLDFFNKDKPIV